MFTMLLMMIVNVARHADDKIKMQNAADASAYSGGVVLARGMNSIAYTNHLLCDVFAVTAFLREGRDRNAEQPVPEILDAWQQAGKKLLQADFIKFKLLGTAIIGKTWNERQLVTAFGDMTEEASRLALPVFESILEEELIPEFQRAVIRTIPELAQQSAGEVAFRHGLRQRDLERLEAGRLPAADRVGRGRQYGVLWRTRVEPVGFDTEDDPRTRTLPVVDPSPTGTDFWSLENSERYALIAIEQRRKLSRHYLELWNRDKLRVFDRYAKMSNFSNLWRIYTCGQLEKLLTIEYPLRNLPMLIRMTDRQLALTEAFDHAELDELFELDLAALRSQGFIDQDTVDRHLEENFQFVGVVYREHLDEMGPRLFRNPLSRQSDALAYAQVSLFVPSPRHVLSRVQPRGVQIDLGGTFGVEGVLDQPEPEQAPDENAPRRWVTENWPTHWDLFNQNWTVKLVPATAAAVPDILQTDPGGEIAPFRLPRLDGVTIREIKRVSGH